MNTNSNKKIAYILDSFPSIAQTFVIREISEIGKYIPITICSLQCKKRKKYPIHKQAEDLVKRTYYFPGVISCKFWRTIFSVNTKFPDLCSSLWNEGIKIFKKLEKISFLASFYYFLKLLYFASIFTNEQINHIHIHFAGPETTFGLILANALKIPFSFTAHGRDLFLQDEVSLTEKGDNAKFIVLGSEFTRNFFINKTHINQNKVLKIFAGVDPDEFKFVSYEKRIKITKQTGNIPQIITVGRLVEEKGYPYVLGACKILKEKGVNFKYTIVGKGSKKKIIQLKNLCKKYNIENNVEIVGALTIDEIKPLYEKVNIFVLGSVREVIGVVLMEAMSCGIPVVATNITGIPELVKNNENGLLVEPKDEQALAIAIEKILNDDNLASKFGLMGRQTIIENFDLKKTNQILVEAFLE